MATEVAALVARLEADVRDFERGMKKADDRLDKLEKTTKKTQGGFNKFTGDLRKLTTLFGVGFAVKGAVNAIGSVVSAASDLEESINAVQVVFGDASSTVLDFAANTEDAVFVAESELNQLATVTGSLLQNFGFTAQQAADETVTLTKRAADMASVFNVDVSEALTAINAALRGETEPIRRFGVNVDEATTKAKALELGLIGSGDALDMNAKVAARMNLILEQTAKVQGDAENTAGSFANQMRKLEERMEAAKVKLGQALIPTLEALIPVLIDVIEFSAEAGLRLTAAFGSDAARHAIRVKEAVEEVNAALKVGKDPATAYAEGLEKLARKGLITADNLALLAQASGASDEQIAIATRGVYNYVTQVKEADTNSKEWGKTQDKVSQSTAISSDKLAVLEQELNRATLAVGNASGSMLTFEQRLTGSALSAQELGTRIGPAGSLIAGLVGPSNSAASSLNGIAGALGNINTQLGHLLPTLPQMRDIIQMRTQIGGSFNPNITGGPTRTVPTGGSTTPTAPTVDTATRNLVNAITGGFGFAQGGVVPGPIGAPMLATVHGGETVIPVGGNGGGETIVVQNYIGGRKIDEFVITANDRNRRRGRG